MSTPRAALGAAFWLGLAVAIALYAACAVYVRVAPPWLDSLGGAVGEVLMREGMRLESAGALENAEARYTQALAADFAGAFNRTQTEKSLGALLWRQRRYAAAVPHLQAALEGPFPSSSAYEPLIDALYQLERLEEAEAVVRAWRADPAVMADPVVHAAALFQAGRIALRRGDTGGAISLYEESLALNAASTSASDLGILYAERGDTAKAIDYLDHYLAHGGSGERADYARQLRSRLVAAP